MLVALAVDLESLSPRELAAVTPAQSVLAEALVRAAGSLPDDLDAAGNNPDGIGPAEGGPVEGWVLLATCNRVELYLDAARFHDAVDLATAALAASTGTSAAEVARTFHVYVGAPAAEHLFSVASGLRSLVIGEAEITSQVRGAFNDALHFRRSTPTLNDLFQQALRTAKRVSSATDIGAAGRSGAAVALDRAARLLGAPDDYASLVIGTGSYAHLVVAELMGRGAREVGVHSPSGRSADFAVRRGACCVSAEDLPEAVADARLIVACSGRGDIVLTSDLIPRDRTERVVLDLALRSDVAPDLAEQRANVTILGLTSLALDPQSVVPEALTEAERIVADGVARFEGHQGSREADPVIVALRGGMNELVAEEVERVRAHDGPEAADQVARSLHRVYSKLLHAPTARAREHALRGGMDEYVAALHTVLGVDLSARLGVGARPLTIDQTAPAVDAAIAQATPASDADVSVEHGARR